MRHQVDEEDLEATHKLFAADGPAFGKPFFDDDWLRIYPDMTFEILDCCDCENEKCQVDHELGGCLRPGKVAASYGRLGDTCAVYMPKEYLI